MAVKICANWLKQEPMAVKEIISKKGETLAFWLGGASKCTMSFKICFIHNKTSVSWSLLGIALNFVNMSRKSTNLHAGETGGRHERHSSPAARSIKRWYGWKTGSVGRRGNRGKIRPRTLSEPLTVGLKRKLHPAGTRSKFWWTRSISGHQSCICHSCPQSRLSVLAGEEQVALRTHDTTG